MLSNNQSNLSPLFKNRPYSMARALVNAYAELSADGSYFVNINDIDRDDLYDVASAIYEKKRDLLIEALGSDNDFIADIEGFALDMLICPKRADNRLFQDALLNYVKPQIVELLDNAVDDFNFDQSA